MKSGGPRRRGGLFVVLATQAGVSVTANDTSASGTSESLRGSVRIHLRGYMKGPQFAAFGRGRFTASGAITDRGMFVDEFHGIHPPGEPHDRTRRGVKGTLRIEVDRYGQPVENHSRNEGVRGASRAGNRAGSTGSSASTPR